MKNIQLNNGITMPIIGLGTWPLNKLGLFKAVYFALKSGYTHFDTSTAYGNELWLGRSLKFFKLIGFAKNIFITTKLSNKDQRSGEIRKALEDSMQKLGVSQIDLYLMHWPNPDTYLKSWKEMEKLYKEGLVKSIGVCNFHEHHLEKLLEIAEVIPVINQVELHPLLSQANLRNFCTKHNIRVESYSPIARMHPKLIENNILKELSKKYTKTVPQIILRWNVQQEIITIPKASSFERIHENIDIFDFELSNEEMLKINNLNENFRVRHNPDTADFSKL